MLILQTKYDNRYDASYKKKSFDSVYDTLYSGLRTNLQGPFHYFSIYLVRKMLFAFVVYFFSGQEWALF